MANTTSFAAIYARVSLDRNEESVTHQVSLLKEFAKSRGLKVKDEFIYEDVVSGSRVSILERQSMQRLIRDANAKKFEVVMFKGISRFARDTQDALETLGRLKAKGLRVISYEENYDSMQQHSDFIFTLHAALAEQESEKIGIRVRLGRMESAKSGKWLGSPPFGYDVRPDKKLRINESEAEVVREIFKLYTHSNLGTFKIAQALNDRGIRTRAGRMWSRKSVSDILRRELYTGSLIYNKQTKAAVKDYDHGKKKKIVTTNNDRKDWVIVKDNHTAIIDEKTFQIAQEMLDSKRVHREPRHINHPLTGIAKCGKCGEPMVCNLKRLQNNYKPKTVPYKDKTYEYRYYMCRTRHRYGTKYCSQPTTRADHVEEFVWEELTKILKEHLNKLKVEDRLNTKNGTSHRKLKNELSLVEKKIEKINKDTADLYFKRDDMTEDQYNYLAERLKEESVKLLEKKNELQFMLDSQRTDDDKKKETIQYINEFFEVDRKNIERLRKLLNQLVEKIVITDGHIDIYTRF